jgi:uncharacterized protein YbaP (TraB family)
MKSIFFKRAKELFFALFVSFLGKAQTPIFEISGNGLKTTSYLMGTMHLGCEESKLVPSNFRSYLIKSEALVLEMNLKKVSEQIKITTKAIVPKERSLDRLMGARYSAFKTEVQQQYQLDVAALERFHPMMTTSLLAAKLLPCSKPKGSETILMDVADSLKIRVIGLETASDQANILFSMPDSEAVRSLWEMGTNRRKAQQDWDELQTVFALGNIDSIAKFIEESDEMKMDLEKMLFQRNRNWMKTLPALMKKKSVFIAVGAGHLGGSHGLVALLREAGYHVVEKQ